jgi:hypothetical protein
MADPTDVTLPITAAQIGRAVATVHVVALIKGTAEGDPYQHFGSLLGADLHQATAVRLGLLTAIGDLTDTGRAFYEDARLADLPAGRATHWGEAADRAVVALNVITGKDA